MTSRTVTAQVRASLEEKMTAEGHLWFRRLLPLVSDLLAASEFESSGRLIEAADLTSEIVALILSAAASKDEHETSQTSKGSLRVIDEAQTNMLRQMASAAAEYTAGKFDSLQNIEPQGNLSCETSTEVLRHQSPMPNEVQKTLALLDYLMDSFSESIREKDRELTRKAKEEIHQGQAEIHRGPVETDGSLGEPYILLNPSTLATPSERCIDKSLSKVESCILESLMSGPDDRLVADAAGHISPDIDSKEHGSLVNAESVLLSADEVRSPHRVSTSDDVSTTSEPFSSEPISVAQIEAVVDSCITEANRSASLIAPETSAALVSALRRIRLLKGFDYDKYETEVRLAAQECFNDKAAAIDASYLPLLALLGSTVCLNADSKDITRASAGMKERIGTGVEQLGSSTVPVDDLATSVLSSVSNAVKSESHSLSPEVLRVIQQHISSISAGF